VIAAAISGWLINVSIAFTALRTNLMRSILTTLGVMIGVLAVILAVAIGQGAKSSIIDSIGSLGSNMAIVLPVPDTGDGPRRSSERGRLTNRDSQAIAKLVPGVVDTGPQLRTAVQIVSGGRNASTNATGITPGYGRITSHGVDAGRFISEADVNSASRVVDLGPDVARKLFGGANPLGQLVRINKVPFIVVGVLEEKGDGPAGNLDDLVFIPISTARQRFSTGATGGPDDLQMLYVGFDSEDSLKAGKKSIIALMHQRYRVQPGDVNPFTVRTTEEFMETAGTVTSVLQALLVGIASISLLVGGIGIMNIMLVSVTERTREIGLRMALGAKRRDIRNQFLVEAAVLCVIGGIIGLSLAAIAAYFLEPVFEFAIPIGMGTTIFAILFSATIGLLFGGYPAVRASRLSPIEALRSE
jgi:putative ABC transport system permease protein